MRPNRILIATTFLLAVLLTALSGCKAVTVEGTTASPGAPAPSVSHERASVGDIPKATAADLAKIRTAGPRHHAGYSRDQYGPAWSDVDHNGCDTRDDILARDLTDVVRKGRCEVESGVLADPYTGKTIHFTRGRSTSTAIQIDHTVPLSLAWDEGAWKWSAVLRKQYANDPLVLVAADGPANERKGDSGPAEWAPAQSDWCAYATRFIDVLSKYDLPVTTPDRAKLAQMLRTC